MQASDIPRVAEIHVFGWRCAYRGILSDEHMFNTRLVSTQIAKLEERFKNGEESGRFVYDDGIIKAFLYMGPCRDADKPEAFELGAIYVDPCMKGQGIGTAMAEYCEKTAAQGSYKEVCLWTFEKNAPARAFYEKLGYVLDGATKIIEPYDATGVRYCKSI